MGNTLTHVIGVITNFTATQYADAMLEKEKDGNKTLHIFNSNSGHSEKNVSYEEYMKATWGNSTDDSIESCTERSRVSKLNEYAHYIVLYTGFINNGKVFILNKKEKFVSFLYDVRNNGKLVQNEDRFGMADLYVHYNPLNVDCISESVKSRYLFDKMSEDYEISKDEAWIISECDKLIKNS